VSRLFDSQAALRRLKDATTRSPRPVGVLRRIQRDTPVRQFFVTVLFAAATGLFVGFF
jgi:hypothetical protein